MPQYILHTSITARLKLRVARVRTPCRTPQLRSTAPLRSNPYCGRRDHLPFACGVAHHLSLHSATAERTPSPSRPGVQNATSPFGPGPRLYFRVHLGPRLYFCFHPRYCILHPDRLAVLTPKISTPDHPRLQHPKPLEKPLINGQNILHVNSNGDACRSENERALKGSKGR